jgi:nicotinamide N-methyltransferase
LSYVQTQARSFTELTQAETAHQQALTELEQMREAMVKMEQERLEMVAEVEAQIERALLSMQVDMDDDESDYESRSGSRMSTRSGARTPHTGGARTPNRKHSDASYQGHRSHSGTESTLVDYENREPETIIPVVDRSTDIIEEEEEPPLSPNKKRFSAYEEIINTHQDAMVAVDQGITEKSDRIAQKVLQIQKKVSYLGSVSLA